MARLGFKRITWANWLEPDGALDGIMRPTSNGVLVPLSSKDYLEDIYRPSLGDNVPEELHDLFEVARGAMSYGYFFYPLFTLAADQLFRIAERAIAMKCESIAAPKSKKTFEEKIAYLRERAVLSEEDKRRWDGIRDLRNRSSHPDRQDILPPAVTIHLIATIAGRINSLYDDV
jgi:hypothetical protein